MSTLNTNSNEQFESHDKRRWRRNGVKGWDGGEGVGCGGEGVSVIDGIRGLMSERGAVAKWD